MKTYYYISWSHFEIITFIFAVLCYYHEYAALAACD